MQRNKKPAPTGPRRGSPPQRRTARLPTCGSWRPCGRQYGRCPDFCRRTRLRATSSRVRNQEGELITLRHIRPAAPAAGRPSDKGHINPPAHTSRQAAAAGPHSAHLRPRPSLRIQLRSPPQPRAAGRSRRQAAHRLRSGLNPTAAGAAGPQQEPTAPPRRPTPEMPGPPSGRPSSCARILLGRPAGPSGRCHPAAACGLHPPAAQSAALPHTTRAETARETDEEPGPLPKATHHRHIQHNSHNRQKTKRKTPNRIPTKGPTR